MDEKEKTMNTIDPDAGPGKDAPKDVLEQVEKSTKEAEEKEEK